MDYRETLDYIDSFIDFEKIPGYAYASSFRLERMHAFLQELGNPHLGLNTIHIAGSKGKGSTCAIIASLLKEAGYSVGLYTSPHLLDVKERIKIVHKRTNHKCTSNIEDLIGEKDFIELIGKIKPVAERFKDHKTLGKLSFFEVLTACAFLHFKEKRVDFAVLETGLGGRLDATNVTEPLVCGITNISFEHTDKLGNSLGEIAREKAGIIKSQVHPIPQEYGAGKCTSHKSQLAVFSVLQEKEVIDVIREVCREKDARLHEVSRDLPYENLEINLLGRHQVENAGLAIAIAKFIDTKIDEKAIRRGLKNVDWPGRLQIVQREPYAILDGAQNVASINAVLSSIKEIFHYKRLICVFGISSDKDIKGVSEELDRASDLVILTRSRNERASEPFYLKENFSRARAEVTNSVEEALKLCFSAANKEDLILITGSLYVVGDAMNYWSRQNLDHNLVDVLPRPNMHEQDKIG